MRRAERVVFALGALGEAGQAAALAQGADAVAPAGQDLVRIGLVADVPDQPVVRRVEELCSATVSSTTPSPAPRWPPVTETASMVSARSSSASCLSCSTDGSSSRAAAGRGQQGVLVELEKVIREGRSARRQPLNMMPDLHQIGRSRQSSVCIGRKALPGAGFQRPNAASHELLK